MWLLAGPIKCNWPSVTLWSVFQYPVTYTDSSHELRDLQHFMSEQIGLHVFKAITAASCVDIIVNKRLNKYN